MLDSSITHEEDVALDDTPLDLAHGSSWDEGRDDEEAADDPFGYDFRPHLEDPD